MMELMLIAINLGKPVGTKVRAETRSEKNKILKSFFKLKIKI